MTRIAFVCVGNAGRSQMAAALAERERDRRGLDVEILSGGTDPAEHVHEEVVTALGEEGIDVSDRTPRRIAAEDLADADYAITMGCDVGELLPAGWEGDRRAWDIPSPHGAGIDGVREQRDDIADRVRDLFDEIEAGSG